ncbi:MAG: hypothetical protein PHY92_03925 [Alphaproteobacteria bacterium]|nr:hypothetical protein [Alphaproteobacteria bacterium]
MNKPATSSTLYLHDGFNPTRTRQFAERLEVFQCPVVFTAATLLHERIQACLASINDPKVDVNAYYHSRPWFYPIRSEHVPRKPLAFFAAAVVNAPPAVIEAMMDRQDTDVNVTTPGPECSAGPIGMLGAHIAFRDRRDGRDPARDGLHPDTVGAFKTLFSAPRFGMMPASFIYDWNAYGDLQLEKSPYLDAVENLVVERNTILAQLAGEDVWKALDLLPVDILDQAGTVTIKDRHDNRLPLKAQEADDLLEIAMELPDVLNVRLVKRMEAYEKGPHVLDGKKLLKAEKWRGFDAAERVAGTVFMEALEEIFSRKFTPERFKYGSGEPDYYGNPRYNAATKIASQTLYAYFQQRRRQLHEAEYLAA